ncbi:MAG: hypothetical protein EPO13_09455 [Actinomycetota bacterium]|nr:MAG: hypothetical protein EPO13_09455 [Actinomycetota bacterium]
MAVFVPAHGIGGRQDLPIPFGLALTAAALAVTVSFVALAVLWHRPRYRSMQGRDVPAWLATTLSSAALRTVLRLGGLLAVGYVALAAFVGPDNARNPTAGAVYVLFWVGTLAIASALFGPVWRALNPLRTLHLGLARLLRLDPANGAFRLSDRVGCWPAALTLLAFLWLELAAPDRTSTVTLRVFLLGYGAVVLVGAIMFGSRWIDRADGFELYSTLLGRLSLLSRADDGRWVWRSPLASLSRTPAVAGLAGFVVVMLGSTAFDGFSNSPTWFAWAQDQDISFEVLSAGGLVVVIALMGLVYVAATTASGALGGGDVPLRRMPAQFAHSIVPIALGYVVAHYYSFLVLVGWQTLAYLSDPFGTGANLWGTAGWTPPAELVDPTLVSTIMVVAVVAGHVGGVLAAHDRAIELFPRRRAILGQVPLMVVMVGYTLVGLLLLFAT